MGYWLCRIFATYTTHCWNFCTLRLNSLSVLKWTPCVSEETWFLIVCPHLVDWTVFGPCNTCSAAAWVLPELLDIQQNPLVSQNTSSSAPAPPHCNRSHDHITRLPASASHRIYIFLLCSPSIHLKDRHCCRGRVSEPETKETICSPPTLLLLFIQPAAFITY